MRTKTVDAARGKWYGVLTAIGIGEQFLRNKQGPCPICAGETRFRFDDKDGQGSWICNKCGAGYGIDLAMRVLGMDYKTACAKIDEVVGNVKLMSAKNKKKDNTGIIEKIVRDSGKAVDGDASSRYLHARGLTMPRGIKTHAGLDYWEEGRSIGKFPAMVARILSPENELVGIHVTYLDGDKKADVPSQRKLYGKNDGAIVGGAVRLFDRAEKIAVAEGIETALAYHSITGTPCWATTNAMMLSRFLPPEGVKHVVVAGDNDANYCGQHHAYALADLLVRKGYQVDVEIPATKGADWCDVLQMMNAAVTK